MVHRLWGFALVVALLLAQAARSQIDEWDWSLTSGVTLGPNWLVLQTPNPWLSAKAIVLAPDRGTLTIDVIYHFEDYPLGGSFTIASPAGLAALILGSDPQVCPTPPCTETIEGISLHLDEGDEFSAFLNMEDAYSSVAIVALRNVVFTPDVGIFEAGDGLAGGVLAKVSSPTSEQAFGEHVVAMDDVDHDGHADLLVGSGNPNPSLDNAGRLDLVSGKTLLPLWTYIGPTTDSAAGNWIDRVGDVDGDGSGDVIVGLQDVSPGPSALSGVQLLSGANGTLLLSLAAPWSFGQSVACTGDLDGDSIPDFAVGVPFDDQGGPDVGAVQLRSGSTGSILFVVTGSVPNEQIGRVLAGVGDVDADGVPDLAIGSDQGGNRARVVSGAGGAVLYEWLGDQPEDQFGRMVAAAGDVNGDGRSDVVVGAASDADGEENGYVRVFSGADGSVLFEDGDDHFVSLASASAVGDIDGDGLADVLIGAPSFGLGRVFVLGGPDGHTIFDEPSPQPVSDDYGASVSGGFDVDGDSVQDLLVGDPGSQVLILTGVASEHIPPHLVGSGTLAPGTPLTLSIEDGLPFGAATLVIGLTAPELPFKGGVLVPFPDVLVGGLVLDAQGSSVLAGIWPSQATPGFEAWVQLWALDPKGPQGWTASNALQLITP